MNRDLLQLAVVINGSSLPLVDPWSERGISTEPPKPNFTDIAKSYNSCSASTGLIQPSGKRGFVYGSGGPNKRPFYLGVPKKRKR